MKHKNNLSELSKKGQEQALHKFHHIQGNARHQLNGPVNRRFYMKIYTIALVGFIFWLLPVTNISASEFIYATDGVSDVIRVYDKTGHEYQSITNTEFNFPTLLEGFNDGQHLITDINFTSWGSTDLVKLDLSGNILSRVTSNGIFGRSGGGIVDVINSGKDTFFVTSTLNSQIAEIDSNLNFIRRFPSGVSSGGGLRTLGGAVSNDGSRLFIADADGQSGNGLIRIFDTITGDQIGVLDNPLIEFPFMLEFNESGELFLTDRGASFVQDNIFVFSETGVLLDQFTSGAPIHYNFGAFDLDSAGNLVLLETNFNTTSPIRVLNRDGAYITEFGDGLRNSYGILVMSSVPIPSTFTLFIPGILALLFVYRRT